MAWAAWTCVWAGIMILGLSAAGACRYIHLFTRFSGELFGALIAVSSRSLTFCCAIESTCCSLNLCLLPYELWCIRGMLDLSAAATAEASCQAGSPGLAFS